MNNKLSIIIPVYNVEDYVISCLDSIYAQSYKNFEIICVNDGSTDKSLEIIKKYSKDKKQLKIINHTKNKGLFHARLTGLNSATGEYIAFVDSDDTVSCDWFRPLIQTLVADDSDMVIGNTINVDEKGNRTYYNHYRKFNFNKEPINQPALSEQFFSQQGECFIWHTVWNKVYRKTLIDKSLPFLKKMPIGVTMGEDIAFSSVFYTNANKMSFCNNDCYFYVRHKNASTSTSLPLERMKKNVDNIIEVFSFVDKYLTERKMYLQFESDYLLFKEKYFRIWCGNIYKYSDKELETKLLVAFNKNETELPRRNEFFFYDSSTPWDDKLEEIKYKILHSNVPYVSFDIFDTLIVRPVWDPEDLIKISINNSTSDSYLRKYAFLMRRTAEVYSRNESMKNGKEDVNLDQIYDCLTNHFHFNKSLSMLMKLNEKDAEIKYSFIRHTGKELFDYAKDVGKKVILISDMYLNINIVKEILNRNSINGFEKLYVSSDIKKLKKTGSLYNHVLDDLKISPEEIIHIGDSWESDIISAQKLKIQALFLPKYKDTYCNNISNIYTGDSFKNIYCNFDNLMDTRNLINQFSFRKLLSLAAMKMFDNPFVSFNKQSWYNADPYYVGYLCLGMHIYSIAKWLYDICIINNYSKICFFARDGFLIKKVFDKIVNKKNAKIESFYFYGNRRTLMPYVINEKSDAYKIMEFMDYRVHTPRDIIDLFNSVSKSLTNEDIKTYSNNGFELDTQFKNEFEFVRFLNLLGEISLDTNKITDNKKILKKEFKQLFTSNTVCFDLGYSGKLQMIISDLIEKPLDTCYLHDNGFATKDNVSGLFKIYNYYDYTPNITSILRETLISEISPACKEYSFKNGTYFNIFDDNKLSYSEQYSLKELQRGAENYCNDLLTIFGADLDSLYLRNMESSILFEEFLVKATQFDRNMMKATPIEDKVHSGYDFKNYTEIWNWHIENINNNRTHHNKEFHIFNNKKMNEIGNKILYICIKVRDKLLL